MGLFHRFGKRDAGNKGNLNIMEERRRILSSKSDFFIREAYKTLRTNVMFSLTGESLCKMIVVTSALQSEGKSVTTTNLALSFAELGKKVLLIDCDLRKPKLGRLLNLSAPAGLSNVLMEPELLEKALIQSFGGVDIILAGDIPPNPSELLASARMEKLLGQMKERYEYIIVDTPPINMVTDAMVLAPQSDGVLFVVRANQSDRNSVGYAIDQLDYAQVKVLGFVLNGVELEKSSYGYGKSRYSRYRRYGRYGYGHGYGYGYGQQSAPAKPVEQAET